MNKEYSDTQIPKYIFPIIVEMMAQEPYLSMRFDKAWKAVRNLILNKINRTCIAECEF